MTSRSEHMAGVLDTAFREDPYAAISITLHATGPMQRSRSQALASSKAIAEALGAHHNPEPERSDTGRAWYRADTQGASVSVFFVECANCSAEPPLERHHAPGRDTVLLCPRCHQAAHGSA
jgi:hypothetical protein